MIDKLEYCKSRKVKSPTRAHVTDAGIDFFVPEDLTIETMEKTFETTGHHLKYTLTFIVKYNKNHKYNMEKENFILKKIRYYQATVSDYETFWNEKIKESQSEISDETKELKKHNDDLNKDFEIVPVEKD